MNVQTERLENHTARLTVEVEPGRLDKAKQEAARQIARKYTIPGFRKGKAPYRVVENHFGAESILNEAVEVLSNEVYKDVLEAAAVDPYGPGSLEDFNEEPQPTFKFVVPLQPTADLGSYREIRLDYEAPVIEDKDVDAALQNLQEREAVIEESSKPVAAGSRVTVKMKASYLDSPETEADSEESHDEEEAHEHERDHDHSVFIDDDDLTFRLTPQQEPAPGFTDALMGAQVGDHREFDLTYPDDAEEFEHLAGRHVSFDVTVKKIESVTLPTLNDDFAARVSQAQQGTEGEGEDKEPETLLQLRIRIREDLQKEADDAANSEYAQKVLDTIIEGTTFAYPEVMVTDEVEHLLHHLDSDLRRRGLTLDDYMKVAAKTPEDLFNDYRDNAVESIKRSLTMRELIKREGLVVGDDQVSAEIDRIAARFGEQAAAFRSIYEGGTMRDNLRSDLLYRQMIERVAAIARGQAPELTESAVEDSMEEAPPSSEEGSEEEGETT